MFLNCSCGGDPNLYRYVFNNTTRLIDPYGTVVEDFVKGFGEEFTGEPAPESFSDAINASGNVELGCDLIEAASKGPKKFLLEVLDKGTKKFFNKQLDLPGKAEELGRKTAREVLKILEPTSPSNGPDGPNMGDVMNNLRNKKNLLNETLNQ